MAIFVVGFCFSHGVAENLNWNQGHARELFLAPCTVEEASLMQVKCCSGTP